MSAPVKIPVLPSSGNLRPSVGLRHCCLGPGKDAMEAFDCSAAQEGPGLTKKRSPAFRKYLGNRYVAQRHGTNGRAIAPSWACSLHLWVMKQPRLPWAHTVRLACPRKPDQGSIRTVPKGLFVASLSGPQEPAPHSRFHRRSSSCPLDAARPVRLDSAL